MEEKIEVANFHNCLIFLYFDSHSPFNNINCSTSINIVILLCHVQTNTPAEIEIEIEIEIEKRYGGIQ